MSPPSSPLTPDTWRRAVGVALADAGLGGESLVAVLEMLAVGPDAWPDRLPSPPDGPSPIVLGQVYELSLSVGERRRSGSWFTPRAVVDEVVGAALAAHGRIPRRILDPACGGGAFLLGALDALVAVGVEPADAVRRVAGIDLDPLAVRVARAALGWWAADHGVTSDAVEVGEGDGLGPWPGAVPDLVLGNPPFRSPLTTRPADGAEAIARRETGLGPYADLAAVFAALAVRRVSDDGRVALVLPQSTVSSRDVAPLRERCALETCWIDPGRPFTASVHVWAPVLRRGEPHAEDDWADRAAERLGLPAVGATGTSADGATLASLVDDVTAGFRDEYYAIAAACAEADDAPADALPVVTVGQLEPLRLDWGRRPTRLGGTTWQRPVVSVADLPPATARWVRARLRPKVLVPTQGRIVEPVVDRDGRLVPLTPVVSIEADPGELDRIAAVLLAPPIVALAARRSLGTGRHPGAINLAARRVRELPLPRDRGAWDEAAALVGAMGPTPGADDLAAVAARMNRAYGADDDLLAWWTARAAGRRNRGEPAGVGR